MTTHDESEPCGLSHAQLKEACKNIGFDLRCGACAEVFFTGGSWGHEHDEGCETRYKYRAGVEMRAVR